MENTYNEFQGTEFDPNLDFDFEEDEGPNLWPVVGAAAGVAAATGAALIIMGRRRNPTVADNAQELFEQASKESKKSLKAVSKAMEDVKLDEILEEALGKARHTTDGLDDNLEDLLKQAQKMAKHTRKQAKHISHDIGEGVEDIVSDTRKRGRRFGKQADKKVEELSKDLGKGVKTGQAELSALLVSALAKAKDAADKVEMPDIDLEDTISDVRKRAKKALENGKVVDLDGRKVERFLEDLKYKLTETMESVREEVAPKAVDTLRDTAQTVAHKMQDDVVPTAQETVHKVRDDVIPEAQGRAGKLAEEEIAPRARKAASSVNSLFNTLQFALLPFIEKMIEERVPHVKMAGSRVAKVAQEEVIPAAASTAEETVHKVREDVLPRMGEAASQAPDMLSDIWQIARDRLAEAMEKAGPAVVDAAESGKHKAGNVAIGMQEGKQEVVGAVSSAGKGVTSAMGGAASATGRATREFVGILFWLSLLGGLLLLVFVPQRDRQEALWNSARTFMGEAREMWRDLQGPDQYLDDGDDIPS